MADLVTDEAVEAAARALAQWDGVPWDGQISRDAYRRAALTVLTAAAPFIAAQATADLRAQVRAALNVARTAEWRAREATSKRALLEARFGPEVDATRGARDVERRADLAAFDSRNALDALLGGA